MRIGFHLAGIHISGNILCLVLLCKYNWHMKLLCNYTGNPDPRCLNRQNFIDLHIRKAPFKLFSNLLKQVRIHLMIQKTVNLQYITRLNLSIFADSLFKQLHRVPPYYFIYNCSERAIFLSSKAEQEASEIPPMSELEEKSSYKQA